MTDSTSAKPLYEEAMQAAWLGLAVNLVLGLVKLGGGWLSGSVALLSDAVNSLGDSVSTVVVLYALHVAQHPPDDEHPYGHTRAEGIAASHVSLLVILSALLVGWEALSRFGQPCPIPPWWSLCIAGANVLVKEGLYRYNLTIAHRTGSSAIVANAWDHRSDALCALAVLLGLAAVYWGGAAFAWADATAALLVVLAILWSTTQLFQQTLLELMDVQADEPLVAEIRAAALEISGVLGVDKLWVRKSGLEYFADIHIQVHPELTVAAGHRIGHQVKDRLVRQFPALRDVLVHLEPHWEPSETEPYAETPTNTYL